MAKKQNILRNIPPEESTDHKTEEKLSTAKPKKKRRVKPGSDYELPEDGDERGPSRIKQFFKDERTHKITGVFLILFSFYLLIAFTSYLFTWQTDQDQVDRYSFFGFVFSGAEITAENWLGKLGAALSHLLIHRGFGLASYSFVVISFVIGFRLLTRITLLPLRKMVKNSFVIIMLASVSLAFAFQTSMHLYLGGAFGYHVNEWLQSSLGKVGTLLFIVAVLTITIILYFNPRFGRKPLTITEGDGNENAEEGEKKKNTLITEAEENGEASDPVYSKFEVDDDILEKEESGKNAVVDHSIKLSTDTTGYERENSFSDPDETQLDEKEESTSSGDDNKGEFSIEVNTNEEVVLSDDEITAKLSELGEYDPTLDLSDYKFPSINQLQHYGSNTIKVDKEELETNKNRIVDTLKNYAIEIAQIKATVGPTVTLYEIVPAPGVRISKIKNLEDDIALSLSALGIRIIAPIPGKGTIGIEVPNSKPDVVSMRSLISSEKFLNSDYELPVALGKTISNEVFVADLTRMPHLLMAGATGQGKSVGLNAILVSLLYKKHPSQVKFVLVDPKKVELSLYNKIERHFLARLPDSDEAIITNNQKVIHTLNSLCIEMDTRYELLKEAGVRTIKEYNVKFVQRRLNPEKGHRFLPYIVLVVDEFADLIMTAGKEVETPIARLAQLARAVGIHLIIATQRPSVNVITGTIKANFPSRIAFRVTSKVDSRTILDTGGSEQLIGRGDMIYSTGNDLIRLQCGFVDTPEVESICEFIGNQRGYPSAFLLPEYVPEGDEGGPNSLDPDDKDDLFDEAARIVVTHQQGSASLLQRKLKLGYNRAGRLVDQLESAGIIGPFKGSKAREVLIQDLSSLEQFLNNTNQN
ncbi:MAG: DNA translocase FtsK [Flavobacteriales bacterium]